ncbi:MAG TPA: glycosyltransferase [Bacteroidales bacterium]|nr:glycosyltransferase [Bacteroidales bacterium]
MMKILIITYYWPPSGGAGVQRWLKFARYLPEYGIEPVILTVDPEYATFPAIDLTLEKDMPEIVKVYKTKASDYYSLLGKNKKGIPSAGFANNPNSSFKGKIQRFIRGNFFIPDPRKGWNKYAIKKASELIREFGIKNVITTSPPHSSQLIGLKLKQRFPDINWIADFRDPWTDIYYYDQFYPTPVSKFIDRRYEKMVIRNCDSLITVGPSLKNSLAHKTRGSSEKINVITNGYDENDFTGDVEKTSNKLLITYTGTLSDMYPMTGFLSSIRELEQKGYDYLLRFIGSVHDARKLGLKSAVKNVQFFDYADHQTAIRYMRESTVLLLIIPLHPGNRSILTGKLFEYLATGNPVLCLGPVDGDVAEILRETGNGQVFSYNDTPGIVDFLERSAKKPENRPAPSEYNRNYLTGKIVKLLKTG